MAIRVHADVDEVGIVERRRGGRVRRVVEIPRRRPELPEQAAERTAIEREARAAAFGIEVVLVPVAPLLLGIGGLVRPRDVLDLVCAAGEESPHAAGPERGDDAAGAASPIETGEQRAFDLQDVEEVDHVLRDGSLLPRARRIGGKEARGSIAAHVGHDRPQALRRDAGNDVVEAARVVGKAVKEHDRGSVGRTRNLAGDVEN
jgi:hypothetical protein